MQKNKIYLVGYMGSGKSSVGPLLSTKLGYKYIDTDAIIAELEGNSIAQIFATNGEEYFRGLEKKIIRKIKGDNVVVSCGGGLPCHHQNMSHMLKNGVVVWLKVSLNDIISRVGNDANRPLLSEKPKNELIKFIKEHRSNRSPFYKKAKIKVWSRGNSESITNKIINYWQKID